MGQSIYRFAHGSARNDKSNLSRNLTGAAENIVEHRLGQSACKRILLAGMIAPQEGPRIDPHGSAVAEARSWPHRLAKNGERAKKTLPGETAQTHHTTHTP